VFSQNKIDHKQRGGGQRSDADAVLERESLRSLLARPFYWLGFVAVVFLLVFLWSAEQVEGVSATDKV
jgi:hypothetical protein